MSKRYIINPNTNRRIDADGCLGLKIINSLKKEGKQIKFITKSTKSMPKSTSSTKSMPKSTSSTKSMPKSTSSSPKQLISVKSKTTGRISTFVPTLQKANFTDKIQLTPAIQQYLIPKTPTCRQCTLNKKAMDFLNQQQTPRTKMYLRNVKKFPPTLFELTPPENRINKKDVRMFHGTGLSDGWNNIKTYGIKSIGDGDLGTGFYVTSYVERALNYAYESKDPILIEIIIRDADKLKVQLLETKIKKGNNFTPKEPVLSLPAGNGFIWQFAISSPEIIKKYFRINRIYKWGKDADSFKSTF